MSRIRVLVVDDSAFMRSAITRLLSGDDRFEVVGQAKDGLAAVEMVESLAPDVVTMDYNMPELNGVEATRRILARRPVGIVMLSAHTVEGAKATVAALAAGAVDFVTKPGGEVSTQLGALREELLQKLVAAASARIAPGRDAARASLRPPTVSALPPTAPARQQSLAPGGLRVVVIAASTGGPAALERVIPSLPTRADLGFVVVQHMPVGYTAALAERLDGRGPCRVREAKDGDRVEGGLVLMAPGGTHHLELEKGGIVRLREGPPLHGVRPAADVTLRSAAVAFGARAVGVVMTGMGRDGATGLAALKAAGGITLAQDAETSVVYGMPRAAAELGVVDQVVPLGEIAKAIDRVTR